MLTAALAQTALAAQSWVSYAGFLTLVVFDAESGEVHALNAGYAIPRGETEPLTIPADAGAAGRTVLVPGFFAGVAAAHERFGRLPFATLFVPAIEFAEQGFALPDALAAMMARARPAIERSPEARRMLIGEDGSTYGAGALFRQPELAATLRAIAERGAAHAYTGPWAERFVELVRAAGGKVALEDLAAYRARWSEPVRADFRGFEICAAGAPGIGGIDLVEALNVRAAAGLDALADPAERLFWWIQTTHLQVTSYLDPATRALVFGEAVPDERRATKAWAEKVWGRMKAGELPLVRPLGAGSHSDALVAVDADGNVAALVHTSNTGNHWATGIFVDGIALPDSASFQQAQIALAGAGARLPDPTNPLIALKDGRPVLAASTIGAGLHPEMLGRLVAVLEAGKDPAAALAEPVLHLSLWDAAGAATAQVTAGAFEPALLERVRALGQPVRELDPTSARGVVGYWVGIALDPGSSALAGACPARLNGAVFAD